MKKSKVIIIDYNAGNLYSVQHACDFVGLNAEITSDKDKILSSDGVILPGVGAYGAAMSNLKRLGLISPIKDYIAKGKPFMGICLGMQLLLTQSNEFGIHQGLDVIPGKVLRFPDTGKNGKLIRVPQIGWNTIYPKDKSKWQKSYLKNIKDQEFMYFVHSYYCKPTDDKDILSLTNYDGFEYCSAVLRNNVFASQFHPEKSGKEGIKIYHEFAKAVRNG